MHTVYILRCADGTLYAGYTTDVRRRVAEHNGAKAGAKYTKSRRPVRLVHTERFRTLGKALSREAAIKKLTRAEKLSLIRTSGKK
jgi:putative endonuclease